MTELRTPPVDQDGFPAEAASEQSRPAPATAHGAGDWLRWAWRQLTSMRIALILLFLLALGSIPGSMLPQEGVDPGGVAQYYKSHPSLAPFLNHLGLFNVFAAPWFAAIYLLLFTSLVGCVVPRTFRLAGSARARPPRAPRHLNKLPQSAEYSTALAPEPALEVASRVLAGHGFRLRQEGDWISSEKGYLREAGNLLFHLALLGVLISVALGGLFGYKADRLLVEKGTFANTTSDLDVFRPGRLVTGTGLPPFTITLDKFNASYISSGPQQGQPAAFDAHVTYTAHPGGPSRTFDIQVNHPLNIDGANVYLIGHGYAPVFRVTDARGHVVYDQATAFLNGSAANLLSQGVIKATDAQPEQLGFSGVFVPTAIDVSGTLASIFPAPDRPMVSLIAYVGDLGMNSGISQSIYQLDTTRMHQLTASPQLLQPGQTLHLPGGRGSITFVGVQQWASLAITHDPGQVPALICGMAALAGLLLSFLVRRRRVFVRVRGSVVQVGGLARTDASGGFEAEFASLAAELKSAHQRESSQQDTETE
ncbi:MAG: cytochrome c biogenesis protein ResB [Streptosporangiaceae bacterium]|nr:cytochrome c biogenesis protein ResB [Streptosporangiaceae bacterium]